MTTVDVACEPTADGWSCLARVTEPDGSSEHRVSVTRAALDRLISTSRELLVRNADRRRGAERVTTAGAPAAAGEARWVYGRRDRPCRRCGTAIRSTQQGVDLPRTTYWCPRCQEDAR